MAKTPVPATKESQIYSSSSFLRIAGTDLAELLPSSVTTMEMDLSVVVSNMRRNASLEFLSGSISLYVSESSETRSVKLMLSHSATTRRLRSLATVAMSQVPARAYMAPLLNMASAATSTHVALCRLVRRAPRSCE